MGLDIYYRVTATVKPTEEYLKMLKAAQACLDAGLDLPDEIEDWFEQKLEDENAQTHIQNGLYTEEEQEIELLSGSVNEEEERQFIEFDISELPIGTKSIKLHHHLSV